jgi:hypothetical protein
LIIDAEASWDKKEYFRDFFLTRFFAGLLLFKAHILKSRSRRKPTIKRMVRTRNQASMAQELTKPNKVTRTKQHALKNLMKNIKKRLVGDSVHSTGTGSTEIEKSVSFAAHDTVHHTIARQDFSPEELKAAWYSEKEYLQILDQCNMQIHKMDQGKILKDKKYCARGLEALTRMRRIARSKSRAQSIRAVLEEQDALSSQGVIDEEAIGFVYHDITSSCQMWASVIGYRDQQAAEKYMDDEEIQVLPQRSWSCHKRALQ